MSQSTPRACHSGCKCQHCYGLAEWLDDNGIEHQLPPTVIRLRVSTFVDPKQPEVIEGLACTGSMVCKCSDCKADRASLVKIGSRDKPQPWSVLERAA